MTVPAIVVPAVMPAIIPIVASIPVMIPVRTVGGPVLIVAGVGISRSEILTIGVRIKLRAIAGVGDHLLRHRRSGQRGSQNDRGGAEKSRFDHALTPFLKASPAKRG